VAIYLTSEMDSYYFSLAIWNSITKEYPKSAYAIRHNVESNMLWRGKWQKHNYKYYLCETVLYIIATKTKYRNELNAVPDMIILLSSI